MKQKSLMKKIFSAIAFIILCLPSFAYYDFNSNCKKAYLEILNLRFEKGKQMLDHEKTIHPSNDIPFYIENYIDFLTLMTGEEEDAFNKLKSNKNKRLERLEKGEKTSPYYRYCIAETYLQWAFARMKFQEYFTAAYEINKAYQLLMKNQEEFPWFIQNMKGLGVIHVLIGTIPDNYKWVTDIIGIESTVRQGVDELERVYNTTLNNNQFLYLKMECAYLLTSIQLNVQNNKEEINFLNKQLENISLDSTINKSPLLTYCRAKIDCRIHSNNHAIKILLSRQSDKDYYPFHYLEYLTGIVQLNHLDIDAYKYFNQFLINNKGKNYVKSSYQKLAWYYLINGNLESYQKNMLNVLKYGSSIIDEDKQAIIEAESRITPNVNLLKARLLFDGGYFREALNILQNSKTTNTIKSKKDSLEYFYRLGRVYHEWGNIRQAIPYYKKTLDKGADSKYYYAANSALQLGYIYENLKDDKLSAYYFQKIFTLKNTEYKNSIEQKAKAELKKLKNK